MKKLSFVEDAETMKISSCKKYKMIGSSKNLRKNQFDDLLIMQYLMFVIGAEILRLMRCNGDNITFFGKNDISQENA